MFIKTILIAILLIAHFNICTAQDSLRLKLLYGYDRSFCLDFQDSLVFTKDLIRYYKFNFSSPKGGKATGWYCKPLGSQEYPCVILQHGMPSNSTAYLPRAKYIAKHSAIVFAMDAPFARRTGPPLNFNTSDSLEQVQMIIDLQCLTDIIYKRNDVDLKRIAFVGRSYGGMIGVMFAAIQDRIQYFILSVPDGGLITHFADKGINGDQFRKLPSNIQNKWLKDMRMQEPILYAPFINSKFILIQSAKYDQNIPVRNAELLHKAIKNPKKIIWYKTDHALNPKAYVDQVNWLHNKIGTDP